MKKLERLAKKVQKLQGDLDDAIADVSVEVSNISGIEEIQGNMLSGDGLGIRIDDEESRNTHVAISDLIDALNRTGTLTRDDLEKTTL